MNIEIVISINQSYVDISKVMLFSLLYNTKEKINLNILTFDKTLDIKNIKELKTKFSNLEKINVVKIERNLKIEKPNHKFLQHIDVSPFGKLFISEYFKDIDKVIYLDSDLIINTNIKRLWNYPTEDKLIAGVKETFFVHIQREFKKKKYPYIKDIKKKEYINTGVMIMKPKKLNEFKYTEKGIEFELNNNIHFFDQDVINVVKPNVKLLPKSWNSTPSWFLTQRWKLFVEHNIIHYVTSAKPWKKQIIYKLINYFLLGIRRTNYWKKYDKKLKKY